MKKLLLLVLVISQLSFAAHFETKNQDRDANCPTWNLNRFRNIVEWPVFGVHESTHRGFDYEVPITRKGVDVVWCALGYVRGQRFNGCEEHIDFDNRPFKRYAGAASLGQTFIHFYDLEDQYSKFLSYAYESALKEGAKSKPNVGLVLEYLSRYFLQELTDMYPKSRFKITGGVEYSHSSNSNTLGELDIIIYEKATCDVVVIGESKASSKSSLSRALKKAHSQLARFRNFLNSNH